MPSSWKSRAKEVDKGWKSRAISRDPERGAVPSEEDDTSIMGGLQESFEETLENPLETAADAMQGIHQGATLMMSDEIAAKAAEIYEYGTNGGDFEKARAHGDNVKQQIRGRVDLARERSPIAFHSAEMLTPNPLDLVGLGQTTKLSKLQKLARSGTAQGGIAAYGGADDDADAFDVALGMGIGSVGDVGRTVTKGLIKNPREIRQRQMGAGSTQFREKGRLKRENIDSFLDDFGFYNKGKKYLSVDNDLNIRPSKMKVPKDMRPSEVMLENADAMITKVNTKAENMLYKVADTDNAQTYSFQSLVEMPEFADVAHSIRMKSSGDLDTSKALSTAMKELEDTFKITGIDGQLSIVDLNNVKRFLQNKGAASMSTAGTDTAASKVYAELQGPINDIIQREANAISQGAGDYIRKANDIQSNLITQSNDLLKRVGSQKASELNIPFMSKTGIASAGAKEAVLAPIFANARVSAGMFAGRNPIKSDVIGATLKNVPRTSVETMKGGDQGRSPQSSDMVGQALNIPQMITKTSIPRDSKLILENKEFVRAKIALAAPQLLPMIEHALYEQPEMIDQLLPMLIEMAPNMFESDVYNRINGKIMNPVDREKALKDNREDESLSNTDKAKRAHSIALKGMV